MLTSGGRSGEAAKRVETAENRVAERRQALVDLEADLAEDLTAVVDEWAAAAADVETVDVPLEKADVRVTSLALAWVPSA